MAYKMAGVRRMAKALGLKTGRKSKAGLIREIQLAEGNFDCFGSAIDECDQTGCKWREMCFEYQDHKTGGST